MANKYLLIILIFITTPVFAGFPVNISLSTGISRDDNIMRAALNNDIESDTIYNIGVIAEHKWVLNNISHITFSTSLEENRYDKFEKLSSTRLDLKTQYQIQPSLEFTAPWYLTSLTYSILSYDSQFREGNQITMEFAMGKRLTDRITLHTGIIFERLDADVDGFDIDKDRFYISLDYKLNRINTLYTTLGYADGDIASTTSNSALAVSAKPGRRINLQNNKTGRQQPIQYPIHLLNANTSNLNRDDAFLDLSPNRYIYKLDATSISLTIGNNYKISSNQSIDLSVFYFDADTYANNDYTGIITQLYYFYRF